MIQFQYNRNGYSVSGAVQDQKTKKRIINAQVSLVFKAQGLASNSFAVSNINGEFRLESTLAQGVEYSATLLVQLDGYQLFRKQVDLNPKNGFKQEKLEVNLQESKDLTFIQNYDLQRVWRLSG